jgi:serine/threonine protein kinase
MKRGTEDTETAASAIPSSEQPVDAPVATLPTVGTVLRGKYRLESKIGEGGMGVVYRATDLEVGESKNTVAVKLIKPKLNTPASRDALIKELLVTRDMHDPHIVAAYAFELDGDIAYMVMEYLTGQPLDRVIENGNALGMRFRDAWPIVSGMAQGLSFAHSYGTVHSDFKPSNVFVTAAGVKVLDFGIARAVGGPLTGISVNYASCEMLEAGGSDPRDDVYAFGLVVYKLLSGKHPFADDTGNEAPATVARDEGMVVPPIKQLTRIQNKALRGALRFDRRDRTKTIKEVLQALERERPPYWLYVLLGTLLAGIGLYFGYQRYYGSQDSDAAFVHHLVNSGAARVSDADAQTVKQLLDLGNQFLQEGISPLNAMLLSENARPLSSALSVFEEVRKADPANLPAARGILAIVNAYKAEARRLLKLGRANEAAELTKIGLRLWPESVELKELDHDARADFEASTLQR